MITIECHTKHFFDDERKIMNGRVNSRQIYYKSLPGIVSELIYFWYVSSVPRCHVYVLL